MFLLNHKSWEIKIEYCLIEYVTMTGGTKIHFNTDLFAGHHDGLIAFIMVAVGISFACSVLFGAQFHWAVEILWFKLPTNSSFFSTTVLELLVLFQMPRDWTEFWKLTLKAIFKIVEHKEHSLFTRVVINSSWLLDMGCLSHLFLLNVFPVQPGRKVRIHKVRSNIRKREKRSWRKLLIC